MLPQKAIPTRPGFSIVEILVSVAVIAVLISLTAPALSRARASARRTASQSNLVQLTSVISMYTNQSAGVYPAVKEGTPGRICDESTVTYPYWQAFETWPTVIFELLPYCRNTRVYISPGSPRLSDGSLDTFPPSYWYSTSFIYQPQLWSGSSVANPQYQRPVRDSQVGFPASKVLLWDVELGWVRTEPKFRGEDLDESCPMAFADGHVAVKKPADATPAITNPFNILVGKHKLHNTANGVLGRDY